MSAWRCPICGDPDCRGDEFCAAWVPRKPPPISSHAYIPMPKPEAAPRVAPTGETRRMDGRREMQYTDGRQTWWAVAREAA